MSERQGPDDHEDQADEADAIEREDILDPNTRSDSPSDDSSASSAGMGMGRGEGGEARPVGGNDARRAEHGGA